MMQIYKSCFDNKVVDVLNDQEKGGKAVLLFNHGLGDFVLFLPLFEELRERFEDGLGEHNWKLYIGCNPERNFKQLYDKCVIMDAPYGKYDGEYDIIFNIIYPEPPRDNNELTNFNNLFYVPNIETISKPYLCNYLEIGLENFKWKPYNFNCTPNNNSNLIGVHFFGHTSVQNKDADYFTAKRIWNQLILAGYDPFEIQMLPLDILEDTETPSFITSENSLRFDYPNLKIMVDKILKCKCFIGVDSGPIYLAGSLLGFDKVLGLQRKREFKKVLPEKINIVDIDGHFDMEIIDFIRGIR